MVNQSDFSVAPINQALSNKEKLDLYQQLIRVRRFEQGALKHYNQGNIGGFLHLYTGQEAVAVGTLSLLGANDHYITAYRDHGHGLISGLSMNVCMAELFGKKTGCSKGKGGSMHFFNPEGNYWGGHGIVAGQTPLGLGLGFGIKYKGLEGCALCFLGEGAVNQGSFHESLNLASLFEIPVIYVIENNGYSMGTSQKRSSAYPDILAKRAEGYNIDWLACTGTDIYEVRSETQKAVERARKESKPAVIEIQTYRYYGHSVADANHKKYRSPEEIEDYKQNHDPIEAWKTVLLNENVATEEQLIELDKEAKAEVIAAVKFANDSPAPTLEDLSQDIYWEVDNQTPAGQTGQHFFNP